MKEKKLLLFAWMLLISVMMIGCSDTKSNNNINTVKMIESEQQPNIKQTDNLDESKDENEKGTILELKNKVKISKVYAGTYTVAAITDKNELYMWGKNTSKNTSVETKDVNQYTPKKMMENVDEVILEDSRTAVITKDNELYMWGKNDDKLITMDIQQEYVITPYKVMEDVKKAYILKKHILVINTDDELYVWGKNIDGKEKLLDNVDHIYCESDGRYGSNVNYTVFRAITTDGKYFTWSFWDTDASKSFEYTEPEQYFKEIDNIKDIVSLDLVVTPGSFSINPNLVITDDGTIYDSSHTLSNSENVTKVLDNVKSYQQIGSTCKLIIDRNDRLYIYGYGSKKYLPESKYYISPEDKVLVMDNVDSISIMHSPDLSDTEDALVVKTKDGVLRIINRIFYKDNNTSNMIDYVDYEDIYENVEQFDVIPGSIIGLDGVRGGRSFILLLDSNKDLYYYYYLYDGDLEDYEITTNTKLVMHNIEYYKELDSIAMAVNLEGELYIWGYSDIGRLGLGENVNIAKEPTKIEFD